MCNKGAHLCRECTKWLSAGKVLMFVLLHKEKTSQAILITAQKFIKQSNPTSYHSLSPSVLIIPARN